MKLELNGIEVVCIIGDLPEERIRTQRLLVDLRLDLDDSVADRDRLEDTVDYVTLSEAVRQSLVNAKCKMIERAAQVVATKAAADSRVRVATARVTKFGSVPGMASATAEYVVEKWRSGEVEEWRGGGVKPRTMKIVKADEEGLAAAVATLAAGGVAVIPTDTVYGLAAHPDFPSAVERLYTIKAREAGKPIALLAADAASAVGFLGEAAAAFGGHYWPGALTVVALGEGVRVPDHAWTRELLRRCGGVLRVTSANLSGRRAATDAPAALKDVGLSADLVVDDGVSPGGAASTVVKFENGQVTVLRPGPVVVQ